jgi:DNA-binding NtrC family response regulator
MSGNIIFVHDDPEFIGEAAAALRLAGHRVVTFREPIEALSALETEYFDILITRVRFR